jgi:hypothetical protein
MVSSNEVRAQLDELKRREFHRFLNDHNDSPGTRVLHVRDAKPASTLNGRFCSGKTGSSDMNIMGIMFHGTSHDCIGPICRDGIKWGSSFTSSFDYAVRRSAYQEEWKSVKEVEKVEVLAMAVLVEESSKLGSEDQRLREPCYSLPLYVVTVGLNR